MNGNINYSIGKFLGSYSIVIENGLKTTKHYNVSEDIVKIIEQLEGKIKHLLDLQKQMDKDYEELQVRVDKAINYIENQYYSKNTTNLENIWYTTDKLLKVREILKGEK